MKTKHTQTNILLFGQVTVDINGNSKTYDLSEQSSFRDWLEARFDFSRTPETETVNLKKMDVGDYNFGSSDNDSNATGAAIELAVPYTKCRAWSQNRGTTEAEKALKDGQNILITLPLTNPDYMPVFQQLSAWIAENGYMICKQDYESIKQDNEVVGLPYMRLYIEKVAK